MLTACLAATRSGEPAGGKHDPKALGEVQNRVSLWETTINRIFSPKEALAYKGLLAEAYARVFDGSQPSEAKLIVDRTALQVEKNGGEILKQRYITPASK